ncbi:hypothetical protein RI367_002091 [Sorochytrium milnesiophthora]
MSRVQPAEAYHDSFLAGGAPFSPSLPPRQQQQQHRRQRSARTPNSAKSTQLRTKDGTTPAAAGDLPTEDRQQAILQELNRITQSLRDENVKRGALELSPAAAQSLLDHHDGSVAPASGRPFHNRQSPSPAAAVQAMVAHNLAASASASGGVLHRTSKKHLDESRYFVDLDRLMRLSSTLFPEFYGSSYKSSSAKKAETEAQKTLPALQMAEMVKAAGDKLAAEESRNEHDSAESISDSIRQRAHRTFIYCIKDCVKTLSPGEQERAAHKPATLSRHARRPTAKSAKGKAKPAVSESTSAVENQARAAEAKKNHSTISELWKKQQQEAVASSPGAADGTVQSGPPATNARRASMRPGSPASIPHTAGNSRRNSMAVHSRPGSSSSMRRRASRVRSIGATTGAEQFASPQILAYYAKVPPEVQDFATFDIGLVHRVLQCRPHERTRPDIERVYQQLKRFKAFEKTSPFVLTELISVMQMDRVDADSCVFKQGDVGTCWYVILSGAIEIYISPTGGLDDMKLVRLLTVGSGFGDLALLSEKPRAATVLARTPAILLRVEKEVYQKVMRFTHFQDQQEKMAFVQKMPGFESLSKDAIRALSDVIQWKTYREGDTIVEEGVASNDMYMIRTGRVHCFRTLRMEKKGTERVVKVADLGPWSTVGEDMALVDGTIVSGVTARAVDGPVTVAQISVHDARTKLRLQLKLSDMYRLDDLALLNKLDRQVEQQHWKKLRKKVLDKYARERLHDPHGRWEQYVSYAEERRGHTGRGETVQ